MTPLRIYGVGKCVCTCQRSDFRFFVVFEGRLLFSNVAERKSVVLCSCRCQLFFFVFDEVGEANGSRLLVIQIDVMLVVDRCANHKCRFGLIQSREEHSKFGWQWLVGDERHFSAFFPTFLELRQDRLDSTGSDFCECDSQRVVRIDLHQWRSSLSELLCTLCGKVRKYELAVLEIVKDIWGRKHSGLPGHSEANSHITTGGNCSATCEHGAAPAI